MANQRAHLMRLLLAGTIMFSTAQSVFAGDAEFPELVEVPAGLHQYRVAGEFLQEGHPVDAPLMGVRFRSSIHIMKHQVSAADYARCVAAQMCGMPFSGISNDETKPATGISFIDAINYATWLSKETKVTWRLPSDEEWSYAAGSRFYDDALGTRSNAADPSKRWLLKYRRAIDRNKDADPVVRALGGWGSNEHGLFDQSGNVWEWTSTCYQRAVISSATQSISSSNLNCGVRVVEGRHRAYMTDFVQDAKSGGCSVGAPPDYLGFRLVREEPGLFSFQRLRNWWAAGTHN